MAKTGSRERTGNKKQYLNDYTTAKRLRFHFCFQFPVSVSSFHFHFLLFRMPCREWQQLFITVRILSACGLVWRMAYDGGGCMAQPELGQDMWSSVEEGMWLVMKEGMWPVMEGM